MKNLVLALLGAVLLSTPAMAQYRHPRVVQNNYYNYSNPYRYNQGPDIGTSIIVGLGAGILGGMLIEAVRPPPRYTVIQPGVPATDCVQVVIGYTPGGQPLLRNYCNY